MYYYLKMIEKKPQNIIIYINYSVYMYVLVIIQDVETDFFV